MEVKTRQGPPHHNFGGWYSLRLIACLSCALLVSHAGLDPSASHAQVTPSGLNTSVAPVVLNGGTQYDITGGTRPGNGHNLFHSFGLFSLPGSSDVANFSNTMGPGITNILSRVTGNVRSDIYGTIQTTNFNGANLFLFNPAGVVFGPGASLNLSGSFHVSTADYVLLSDGVRFNATPGPADALLTSSPPSAFGFLPPTPARPTPAPISVQGSTLQVPEGQILSIVGGDVQIQGATLMAPSGRVQIASVASAGEVGLVGPGGAPALDVTSFSTLGQIEISGSSIIDASDVSGVIGAGTVVIRGGRLTVDSSQISSNTMDVDGAPVGIDIQLAKESVLPDGTSVGGTLTLTNFASVGTATFGLGRGGDVRLTASQIQIDGSSVNTLTVGDGNAGNLSVNVVPDGTPLGGTLTLTNFASVGTTTFGLGRAGDTQINAASVRLRDGSSIASFSASAGTAGDVSVNANEVLMSGGSNISNFTVADGTGGQLLLSAQTVTLDEGAFLLSASLGTGTGGDLTINASKALNLTGGAFIKSETGGAQGGNILVTAGSALISGSGSGIFSGGSGGSAGAPAGNIALNVNQLTLTADGAIQNGTILDRAGNITVSATDSIAISNGGKIISQAFADNVGDLTISAGSLLMDFGLIQASTIQAGNAGNISVNVGTLGLSNGAQVVTNSAASATGRGGNLTVTADSVSISGQSPSGAPVSVLSGNNSSSGLLSTAEGTGNAGTIVVTTPTLTMGDGGTISVATSGVGDAGNIGLNVGNFSLTTGARVDSGTTGSGKGGTVTLNATGSGIISSGAGLFSNAEGSGAGGNLNIQAAQLQLFDGATISARSTGTDTARAGDVNIVSGSLLRMVNSSITTEAAVADGGNISITTTGSTLVLADSQIKTSVQSGVGQGGNITIGSAGHPFGFILLDGSQIRADAFGGPGGNIDIFANVYLTSASVVSASSALSTPGTIAIEATVTDVSGSLTQLPTTPLEAAALMRASCAARLAGGKTSSLVVAGREGLPLDPSGLLPSPLTVEPPVAAVAPDEEFPWLRNLLRVSYLSLDPKCLP